MPVAHAATPLAPSIPKASGHVPLRRSTTVALAKPDRFPVPPTRNHTAFPTLADARPSAAALRVAFATPGDTISSAPLPAPAPIVRSMDTPLGGAPHQRFTLSLWTLVRDGSGGDAFAPGKQLGGSQTGLRVYAPVGHGIALTGQANTPLARPAGAEASLGVALRLPHVTLLAERRIAIGGRGATTLQSLPRAASIRYACPHAADSMPMRRRA